MRKMAIILALVFAFPPGASVALAKSVHKDFVAAWDERAARYAQNRAAADAELKAATLGFGEALKANSAAAVKAMERAIAAERAVAIVDGHGTLLEALRYHMAKKPSAAQTELWVQERVAEIQSKATAADAQNLRFSQLAADPSAHPVDQVLHEAEVAAILGGRVEGAVEEIKLIDQNLGTYYQAQSAEDDARRQSRARIFGAIGAAMRQSQPPPPSSWRATCNTYGQQTRCTGN